MNRTAFNIEEGLQRLMNNKDLYKMLLNKFKDQYGNVESDLNALLEQGDYTGAEEIVHAIKGVAGNLSAIGLHKAAEEFDKVLKTGKTDDLLKTKFVDELAQAINSIDLVVEELS